MLRNLHSKEIRKRSGGFPPDLNSELFTLNSETNARYLNNEPISIKPYLHQRLNLRMLMPPVISMRFILNRFCFRVA